MKKILNGVLMDMTSEEVILKNKHTEEWLKEQSKNEEQSKNNENNTAKENLKASAKAKLIAGQPLTEEEANTIVL